MKKLIKQFNAKALIILAIGLITITTHGQTYNTYEQASLTDFLNATHSGALRRSILSENDIKGSPYLKTEFVLGDILTYNKIHYVNVPLRYNIYNDEIEFEVDKENYLAISSPESIQKIIIGDDAFIYTVKRNKKGEQFGYYQLLHEGKVRLLSRHNIVFKEATRTTGYKAAESAKFEKNSNTYYLQKENDEPHEISNKKDLVAMLGPQGEKINLLIKKEKLNFRKEEDLIKLVKFMNENP
ncbi:MAG: hypothetical protein CVU00_10390 [Bacteroidetes bacterium HGW-Bacteroidetes-17]|jgi:hypothetical protein|nr:MAG: hypothetical protein CVU00_10390 [Bacteroidetes bacterium HGW-Bacteroidetes-17]